MIRPATEGDAEAITRIALLTGAGGEDATQLLVHGNLIAEVYALPYLRLSPAITCVAEIDGHVVGYAVGTPDSAAFDREMAREIWPRLQADYPVPMKVRSDLERWYYRRIHQAEPLPKPVVVRYPAHLHLNTDPGHRRRGIGRALVQAWLAELIRQGGRAVHIGADPRNARGIAFWQACGFRSVNRELGLAEGAWFGQDLQPHSDGRHDD
jgi:ribosomal protein S18 acetylase RimI-like enzyme